MKAIRRFYIMAKIVFEVSNEFKMNKIIITSDFQKFG